MVSTRLLRSPAFLRWQSVVGPASLGVELAGVPLTASGLADELDTTLSAAHRPEASFLVVRITGDSLAECAAIAGDAAAGAGDMRICLAIDQGDLDSTLFLDTIAAAAGDRVGLMVDAVDENTSTACLVHGAVEAIRFDSRFVRRAGREPRWSFALEAMVELARNCGIATLGPASAPNDDGPMPSVAFDYAPTYIVGADHAPRGTGVAVDAVRDPPTRDFQRTR